MTRAREISPLDGRYAPVVGHLTAYFSEFALMRARCEVELRFLLALQDVEAIGALPPDDVARIQDALSAFSDEDYAKIKAFEARVNHDVKACELFLREKLGLSLPNRIHLGMTSEDVNNLAYALLLSRYLAAEQLPQLRRFVALLSERAAGWRDVPFPARTHGQAASPTTLGKELAVYVARLLRQARELEATRFRGKLGGATGNLSALVAACPTADWLSFSERFVTSLDLDWNPCTTQVEDGDGTAAYFAAVTRINTIVLDFDLDLWEYVSRGDVVQKTVDTEVGSSTMPHKVNPIRFENSEGNLTFSTAILHVLCDKLPRSRMQRDLSDSSLKRNIGVALAHAYLGLDAAMKGLERIDVSPRALRAKVDSQPEVLGEAIQTVFRLEGLAEPYEQVYRKLRGREITLDQLHAWIDEVEGLPSEPRARLKALRPSSYLGLAPQICDRIVAEARCWLAETA